MYQFFPPAGWDDFNLQGEKKSTRCWFYLQIIELGTQYQIVVFVLKFKLLKVTRLHRNGVETSVSFTVAPHITPLCPPCVLASFPRPDSWRWLAAQSQRNSWLHFPQVTPMHSCLSPTLTPLSESQAVDCLAGIATERSYSLPGSCESYLLAFFTQEGKLDSLSLFLSFFNHFWINGWTGEFCRF